jgi:hypothetical protein
VSTRSACVIVGATPAEVSVIGATPSIQMRANRLGTLLTGKLGDLVVDYAMAVPGPVYDVMWNAKTGWFAVTIYQREIIVRWDNRPGEDAGYPRVPDVLGRSTPRTILQALDIPADAIDYAEA